MPLVFHIWALPKWARNSHTPIRGAEARSTPVLRGIPIFAEIADSLVSPEFRHGYADIRGVKPVPVKEKVSAALSLALPGQSFVARQPIFDRAQNVFGYRFFSATMSKIFLTPIRNYRPP